MTLSVAIRRGLPSFVLSATFFAVAACAGLSTSARADEVTFVMRNSHPYALRVELYSDDRNHVWPGHGNEYYLDDGESKEVTLSCDHGESICYGAWVDGDEDTYWGVGPDSKRKCNDCCYSCDGGETEEINLVP